MPEINPISSKNPFQTTPKNPYIFLSLFKQINTIDYTLKTLYSPMLIEI